MTKHHLPCYFIRFLFCSGWNGKTVQSFLSIIGNYFISRKRIQQGGRIYLFKKRLSRLSDIAGKEVPFRKEVPFKWRIDNDKKILISYNEFCRQSFRFKKMLNYTGSNHSIQDAQPKSLFGLK
jgi:hypothetical protein